MVAYRSLHSRKCDHPFVLTLSGSCQLMKVSGLFKLDLSFCLATFSMFQCYSWMSLDALVRGALHVAPAAYVHERRRQRLRVISHVNERRGQRLQGIS